MSIPVFRYDINDVSSFFKSFCFPYIAPLWFFFCSLLLLLISLLYVFFSTHFITLGIHENGSIYLSCSEHSAKFPNEHFFLDNQ